MTRRQPQVRLRTVADSKRDLGEARHAQVLEALSAVLDPDLGKDVVSLGFIENLTVDGDKVSFRLVLTTPACPMRDRLRRECEAAVRSLPWVKNVEITLGARVPGGIKREALPEVKHVIAVGSGKGGVGKTTVAVNLAVALAAEGAKTGLLDGDIYGPNVPRMLGIEREPEVAGGLIQPLRAHGVDVMSIGFLVGESMPVIWRGPLVTKAIQQFLHEVAWGELDYLLVDLPPGTGDVQLTLTQTVEVTGAVLVATPQGVALSDTLRGMEMFRRTGVPILGMVENMSYFACPHCGRETDVFGRGEVKRACEERGVAFLGDIPLNAAIREGGDQGRPAALDEGPEGERFRVIARNLAARVSVVSLQGSHEGHRP